jgi:hypothetical protein
LRTVLNPLIVRGQQQGAVAMGISGMLLDTCPSAGITERATPAFVLGFFSL